MSSPPRLLGFKRPRSKDTHVAIAVSQDRKMLIMKVDSNALRGRGTTLKMRIGNMSENDIKVQLMFGAAKLAERQNQLWKDDHDLKDVAVKAAEAWRAVLLDNKLFHGIGTLVPFSPHSPDNDEAQAARVSRASAEDPLTRDILKGKTKGWGID